MNTIRNLPLFLLSILLTNSILAQSQDEFLSAIIEFERIAGTDRYETRIYSAEVHKQRLKKPTRSIAAAARSHNMVRIQILDEGTNILDEVVIPDPLVTNREYVNHHGQLARKVVKEQTKTILIRRPVTADATTLSIRTPEPARSTNSVSFKFR